MFRNLIRVPIADPDPESRYVIRYNPTNYIQIEPCRNAPYLAAVLRIRIRISRIHMFLGLPDPDPLVRGMDPDPDPALDPDSGSGRIQKFFNWSYKSDPSRDLIFLTILYNRHLMNWSNLF